MTSLADFLMRNKLDALGDKPEYTTADVSSLMPQQPSWSSPLAGLGSYQLSQEAGAEPNWFGRNVLSNIPPEAMHAANFLIPGKVPRLPNPIKAYHGSPHDFDKFDLAHIGKGEGAQVYGHGLYFAGSEEVARSYRDGLAPGFKPTINNKPFMNLTASERAVAQWIANTGAKPEEIAKIARGRAEKTMAEAKELGLEDIGTLEAKRHLDMAEAAERLIGNPVEISHVPNGRMYEVALHATPEQFLDWDKPISAQSPHVQRALDDNWIFHTKSNADRPGEYAYWGAANPLKEYPSKDARTAANSEVLREAGIPGLKYLDQWSRGAGSGTSNYVVWSPELIEILRKYAAPPAIAAPALASILQDQQSQ
jgi:hypothetical protein